MYHFSVLMTDAILSGRLHHVEREMNIYSLGNGGEHKQIQVSCDRHMSRWEIEKQIREFFNIYDGGIIYKL